MKISCYQFNIKYKDIQFNLEKVSSKIPTINSDLIILPELFTTGYYFDKKSDLIKFSEKIPDGETTQKLIAIAKQFNKFIIGGIAEIENENLYNTTVIVGPEGLVGKHRKVHLPKLEKHIFSKGQNFDIYNINNVKIGIIQCFDSWFPEASRILMLKGANILINPANFGGPYSPNVIKVRPIENKVYSVLCNRIGSENIKGEVVKFRGESMIVNYTGDTLAQAGKKEEIITSEIFPQETINKETMVCDNIINELDVYTNKWTNYFN
jgi:predicted amidohydrolase